MVIITDSNCDFPQNYYVEHNVPVVSMSITMSGQEYYDLDLDRPDGIKYIAPKEFYARLRAGETAKTSMINAHRFAEAFRPHLEKGEDVLCIAFSSCLSGTYQNAELAAKEMREAYPDRKVVAIDSLCASLGQGLFVSAAIKMRDEGASIDEIAKWLTDNRLRFIHWFTVDDLMFLKRGGRLSTASAIMGTLLSIKPILRVNNEGKLESIDKVKSRKKAIRALFEKMELAQPDVKNHDVYISHGDCEAEARTLAGMIEQKYNTTAMLSYIGPSVGSHAGPGTIALFFVGDSRETETKK